MSPFGIGFTGTVGALAALGLASMVTQLSGIMLTLFVSLFLAIGLNPAVEWMTRMGLKRGLAVVMVVLGVGGLLFLGSWALIPLVVEQSQKLIDAAPEYVQWLRRNERIAEWDQQYEILNKVMGAITDQEFWSRLFGGFVGVAKTVFDGFVSLVITMVLTLYFLASLPSIKEVLYNLAPASRRPRTRYLADEMFRRVGGYLSGMFVVVTLAASAAFVMMQFVGLGNYSLALAFLVGLFAFIPLIGATLSMIVVALVALSISWQAAVAVVVYFLLYQQFEAYVVQPRVMQRSVSVPGSIVVVAALAGGTLAGIVGALVAVPTAAALLLLFREVLLPALDRA